MNIEHTQKAVEFLKEFIPNGLWVLTAIDPEKKRNIETRTFSAKSADQAEDWIADRNGVDNLYFSVNQPEQGEYAKKLAKDDIAVAHFLHVDVDPVKGRELDLQRKQIFDKLTVRRPEAVPRPSVIIDSGGGYQAFWRLTEPQIVENKAQRESVELFNKWLAEMLGGDDCHNLDRIMRLPWTINVPTTQKKQDGRVEALAKPKQIEDITYKLADFSLESPEPEEGDQDKPKAKKVDTRGLEDEISKQIADGPIFVDELEELGEKYSIPRRTLHIIVEGEGDDEEKLKKKLAGKAWTRSEWLFDVVCELERRNVPRPTMLGIIMEPNIDKFRISDSVVNNKDYPTPLDYAVRQLRQAAKVVAEQRQEAQNRVEAVDYDSNMTEMLYEECRGERPSMAGVKSREEAEELDPLLKLINKKFTNVLHVGSKHRIASFYKKPEIGNGKTLGVNKVVPTDFIKQYPMTVTTGYSEGKDGKPGKPITSKVMEWWMRHRYCNTKDRITFAPEQHIPNTLNEWNGFTYEPDPNGKCDLFLKMIKEIICSGNDEYYEYVLDWCARMYQYPGRVGEVALVLQGGSGIGKTFFAEKLGELIISNFYQTAKIERLTSNFNAILRTTVLLFLDEALFGNDKKQYDQIKKYLVSPTIDIEAKGYEQETVANNLHIILASNHSAVVPAQVDDRRLLVLRVSEAQKQQREYFAAIEDQLKENENSGYKALFHFFRTRDISNFKVSKIPQTKALEEQKDHALTMTEQWLLEKLWNEDLGLGRWPDKITIKSLAKLHTTEITDLRGTKWDLSDSRRLSKYIRETLDLPEAKRIYAKDLDGKPETGKGWDLPTIKEAREAWEKAYWKRTDWPKVEGEPNKGEDPNEMNSNYQVDNTPF